MAEKSDKEKYVIMRTRKMYPIPGGWNARSETAPATEDAHGIKITNCWQHIKNIELSAFFLKTEWDRVAESLKERMTNDEKYIPEIYLLQKKAGERLVDLSHRVRSLDMKIYPIEKLFDLYQEFEEVWIGHDHLNVPPWFMGGDPFHKYVENELTEKCKVSMEDRAILLTGAKRSFSAEEELQIYKLTAKILENNLKLETLPENYLKQIDVLVNHFYWIPFGYDGPKVYDREHYIKTIKDLIAKNIGDKNLIEIKITGLENYEKNLLKKQAEIYKKYKIPKSFERLVNTVHTLALMTDERKEYTFQGHEAFHRVLGEIGDKLKIDLPVLKHVFFYELKKYYKTPEKLNEIGERRRSGMMITHCKNGEYEILEGPEAEKLAAEVLLKVENVSLFSGQIACRGGKSLVSGVVRILHRPELMNKVREGEIIVAQMTTPEFVPAMRRSLAIITDEGGVTCHAAIVSRELNIPCIIGTKIATKVLKDGDRVEVDTEKGTVKIIK